MLPCVGTAIESGTQNVGGYSKCRSKYVKFHSPFFPFPSSQSLSFVILLLARFCRSGRLSCILLLQPQMIKIGKELYEMFNKGGVDVASLGKLAKLAMS